MSLFRRKGKCYSCGSDFGLQKCGVCDRSYCVAHGYSGKCLECHTNATVQAREPMDVKTIGTPEGAKKDDLIPSQARASIEYDPLDPSLARGNIMGDLERYKHIYFKTMKIDGRNDEILIYYHIQYISTKIQVGPERLELITDLSRIPDRIYPDDKRTFMKLPRERPMEDESFTGHVRFLHNENLFLTELIIRSMGVGVRNIRNDLPMEMVPMRMLGTCPFCGTVCVGVSKCQTCHRDLPEEIDFRELMKLHARRQYGDKLVAIRTSRMEPTRKRELIAQMEARLGSIEAM